MVMQTNIKLTLDAQPWLAEAKSTHAIIATLTLKSFVLTAISFLERFFLYFFSVHELIWNSFHVDMLTVIVTCR